MEQGCREASSQKILMMAFDRVPDAYTGGRTRVHVSK